jgi:hypothetical protein
VKINISNYKNNFLYIISFFSLTALIISGCNSGYIINAGFGKNYNLKGGIYPSIEVDIIGTTPRTDKLIDKYPLNVYFAPNNLIKKDMLVYKMYFSEENYSSKQLSNNDPIWSKWNTMGITNLYILANLPETEANSTKKMADMRKIKIPFAPDWKTSTINVEIRNNGLFIAHKGNLQK